MAFNKRVGLEPASDLKKRITSLCEEAGFVVGESHMAMFREETLQESVRYIFASVRDPGWNPEPDDFYAGSDFKKHKKDSQIEIRARIGCDGTYDGMVKLTCMATDRVGEILLLRFATARSGLLTCRAGSWKSLGKCGKSSQLASKAREGRGSLVDCNGRSGVADYRVSGQVSSDNTNRSEDSCSNQRFTIVSPSAMDPFNIIVNKRRHIMQLVQGIGKPIKQFGLLGFPRCDRLRKRSGEVWHGTLHGVGKRMCTHVPWQIVRK